MVKNIFLSFLNTHKQIMKKQDKFYDNKKIALQQQKVIDYLQKFKLGELNGDNIAGTILSFKLKIKRDIKSEKGSQVTFDLLSLLLFLDFRTGRVERYLINSSNAKLNKKGIDFKEDLFFY